MVVWPDMGVSENSGTPKSSMLIGFSIINHPFRGIPIFGSIHIFSYYFSVHLISGGSATSTGPGWSGLRRGVADTPECSNSVGSGGSVAKSCRKNLAKTIWIFLLKVCGYHFVVIFGCNHLHVIQCFHIPFCLFTSPCWLLQADLYEMTFGDFESIEIYQCLEISDYKHPTTQNCQDNLWKKCWCFSLPGLRDQVWLHCRRNFEQNMDQMAPDDMLLAPVCQGAQYGR